MDDEVWQAWLRRVVTPEEFRARASADALETLWADALLAPAAREGAWNPLDSPLGQQNPHSRGPKRRDPATV